MFFHWLSHCCLGDGPDSWLGCFVCYLTEMGNLVKGNFKLIEIVTLTIIIGNVVDSITESRKINYNYFL